MEIIKIKNDQEFKDLILSGESAIMIHKTGCPFCEKAKPWIEEVAQNSKTRKIAFLNKEDTPKLMDVFQVSMYPTFVLIKDGKVIDTFFGDTIEDKVKAFMTKEI